MKTNIFDTFAKICVIAVIICVSTAIFFRKNDIAVVLSATLSPCLTYLIIIFKFQANYKRKNREEFYWKKREKMLDEVISQNFTYKDEEPLL